MAKDKRNGAGKSRGRRAQTVDKADKVEKRKAGEGQLPIPEPKSLKHHVATVKGWKEKLTTIQGKLRAAYKAALANHISRDTIAYWLDLERGDPAEFRREMEAQALVLQEMGAPFQIVVRDTIFGSAEDQARSEARTQARAGKAAESRYPEGSPEYEAYMEEYSTVQAEMAPGAGQMDMGELRSAVKEGAEARH